ncbi:hypothetical protein HYY69_06695 [Candidatus Woesearchaeota archaeon]|nr:hypothetical protein [Candidatus Woesearchaeota archaeon]
MTKAYILDNNILIINRDLTQLDIFVRDFLKVLKKYSTYLLVSGYVSICTGRTRATEDIDLLVPLLDKTTFVTLFRELEKNLFWCYQTNNPEEAYKYLLKKINIRFARINEIFPNIEFIPVTKEKRLQFFELNHPQEIQIKGFHFKISPLEFEILYKEIVLGSEKDKADAKHLRVMFSDILKSEKFKEYEQLIRSEHQ